MHRLFAFKLRYIVFNLYNAMIFLIHYFLIFTVGIRIVKEKTKGFIERLQMSGFTKKILLPIGIFNDDNELELYIWNLLYNFKNRWIQFLKFILRAI